MRPVAEKPRYLTYQCRFCAKQERRYRIVAHVLKEHVPLDRVPFYCTWCNFRTLNKESLIAHLTNYPNHSDEVARRGVPDYRNVLKKSNNPIKVDELMFPVSRTSTPAATQGKSLFADKEDEAMTSGAIQLPAWLKEAGFPEPPPVTRSSLPAVPQYVPTPRDQANTLSMPIIGFDALSDDTDPYDPLTVIQNGPPQGSSLVKPLVTTPRANVTSPLGALPANFTSRASSTTHQNQQVLPVQRTPQCQERVTLNTPLLDEIMEESGILPTAADKADPLLQEEDLLTRKRPADQNVSQTPRKRQCTTVQTEETYTSLIADAVSKGTAKICEALGEQLRTMQAMQATMAKQMEETARMERRATSILRLLEDKLKEMPRTQERGRTSPIKRLKSVVNKK